jgi:hypothetical protein
MDSNITAPETSISLRFRRLITSNSFRQFLYVSGIAACAVFLHFFILNQSYNLTAAETKLLSKTAVDNGQVNFKEGILNYNQQNQSKNGAAKLTVSGPTNSTSKQLYRVSLASKVSQGIKFTDANSDLPFKLTPLTPTNNGRYINGRIVYPSENAVGIYTLRRNGIKEDIILNQSPGASYSYSWKLELGNQLEARMLPDGGVGIYSANPLLSSSNLQVSDAKSQALIDKAKKNGKKDTLVYIIPAPFITESNGTKTANNVKFNLNDSTLTLTANNLDSSSIHYPISIDPTVVVTTTADFATGYDDGNIDYSSADEIDRAGIGTGLVNAWHYTSLSADNGTSYSNGFMTARYSHTSVAYNGYLYIIGGNIASGAASGDCDANGFCTGVQFAPINADGTIGAWHYTHNLTDDGATFVAGFIQPRANQESVAYNGYLYILGGQSDNGGSDCGNTLSDYCNGVQFAPIKADGTIGAWNYTAGGSSCSTWTSPCNTGFIGARSEFASVTYNGYIYIMGGAPGSGTECPIGCNGVQYAPINADGTIGAWHYTHNSTDDGTTFIAGFNTARSFLTSVAYNGYLYIMGGNSSGNDCSSACNGVQFAPINANGTIGTWNYTAGGSSCSTWALPCSTGFIQGRYQQTSMVYNGYLYIIGGEATSSGNDCTSTNLYCNGVQFAPINANGTIGTWNYTAGGSSCSTWTLPCSTGFMQPRGLLTAVAYNGYAYLIGGTSGTSGNDCIYSALFACGGVQFASLNTLRATAGPVGTWNYTSNSTNNGASFSSGFTQARRFHTSVAYNGYLYVIGGQASSSLQDCTVGNDCNGVQFAPINTDGTIGAWHYTHNSTDDSTTFVAGFMGPRESHTSVVYNGYLYVIGGSGGGSDCTGGYCNGVQFAPINANGTIGTWNYTYNGNSCSTFVSPCNGGFHTARQSHTSVVYNGYLYIIGGNGGSSSDDCTGSNGVSGGSLCNGVQFAPINANGTIGTWNYTYNGNSCSTFVSPCNGGFHTFRDKHTSITSHGYLYVIGGSSGNSTDDCATSGNCAGVQFAKINANGTIGTWNFTHNSINDGSTFVAGFNNTAYSHTSAAYNGYIYILGGIGVNCTPTADCASVQFAKINSNGTIGTWNYTHNNINDGSTIAGGFHTGRDSHTSVVYNGYLYVIGGSEFNSSADDCTTGSGTFWCNGVQFASLYTGTPPSFGTVNSFTTSANHLIDARRGAPLIAYNGYLYIGGGQTSGTCTGSTSSNCNDIEYAKINSDGSIAPFAVNANHFTYSRDYMGMAANNGYLYIYGGIDNATGCGAGNAVCSIVQYAAINSDGSVGTFTTSPNHFLGRYEFGYFIYNNYLYVAGGNPDGVNGTNNVQYAKINTDGSIGTFTTSGNTFTGVRYSLSANAYNNVLYVIGGHDPADASCNGSGGSDCNDVQYAHINSDGSIGTFTTSSNRFTSAREAQASLTYNGYLYVIGGVDNNDVTCNGNTGDNYCNDVQYAQINSDGSIGAFTTNSNRLGGDRSELGAATNAGYIYIAGGLLCSPNICSDAKYAAVNSPELVSTYEKTVDTGISGVITNISFSGTACNTQLQYKVSSATGAFGSIATINGALPATTYSVNQTGRYLWVQFKMDDATCGTQSQITDFTVTYNSIPAAPTLSSPANAATNVTNLQFQLRSTDADNDYLRYKILICSTNNCSAVASIIDQTASQTGWSGQDQQASTAYTGNSVITSSTLATNTYTGAISKNTQYWWEAFAIDPGGSNNWSTASSINSFTTGDSPPNAPTLVYPTSSSSGNSVLTTFQLRSTESNSDYLRYWIDVCSDSACSSIIRSICQQNTGTSVPDGGACTASQTGWSGQDQQAGTAYSGNPLITLSQLAVHNYQTPYLTKNTTYWWRAYAIDPGGSNTWSSSSAIQSFTTAPTETHIQGNVQFKGNVKL